MRAHGVPVTVIVTTCVGNMGGSGSNVAGYVCRGTYTLDGVKYNEVISSMTTFASPGSRVYAVADPSQHGYVALATAIRNASSSSAAFAVLIVVTALLLLLLSPCYCECGGAGTQRTANDKSDRSCRLSDLSHRRSRVIGDCASPTRRDAGGRG